MLLYIEYCMIAVLVSQKKKNLISFFCEDTIIEANFFVKASMCELQILQFITLYMQMACICSE